MTAQAKVHEVFAVQVCLVVLFLVRFLGLDVIFSEKIGVRRSPPKKCVNYFRKL